MFRDMLAPRPTMRGKFSAIDISRSVIRLVEAASLFLIAASISACTETPGSPGGRLVQQTHASMGTELRLTAWSADEPGAVAAFEAVFQEFDRLEGLLSTWRPSSDIQRLNAAAGKHAVPVGTEFRDVLRTA